MNRRFVLSVVLTSFALPGWAVDQPGTTQLTADQITQLLSGNTIEGTWSGTPYKQFFAPSGMTMYLADGSAPDQGRWRTDPSANTYESWWQMSNWTAYTVVKTDDGYAWVKGDSFEPFQVMPGKQLSW